MEITVSKAKWAGRLAALTALAAVATLAAATGWASPGEARGLKATVVLTQAAIPARLSERALLGFARGHQSKRLHETTAEPLPERKWTANMVVQFNAPPGDLEFAVLFYDVHDGPRRFVEDMSTYVNDRTQKTYLQRINLPRKRFKPNRNMELVVVVRRQEVGKLKFQVLGEEERRSGQVSFGDDER